MKAAAPAPLVSIVVPVRNGGRYLRQSLDSIVAQGYPRLEILLMDDASTDDSVTIAESYGSALTVHRQPHAKGIYDNANDGIVRARGEYIAVYHADDVYLPGIVEQEVEFLESSPTVGAVFCLDTFIDPSGIERGRLELPPDVPPDVPLHYTTVLNALLRNKNGFLRCPGALVRASAYERVGLYRQDAFRNGADLEMWLRIARDSPLAILGQHLYRYRTGHANSSGTYHHLRTTPDNLFGILDVELARGGRALASPDALAAYEAHRAEDQLTIAISYYIGGSRPQARAVLRGISLARLAASRQVQRGRLIALLGMLRLLVRAPHSDRLATAFYRRWHSSRQASPAPTLSAHVA